MFYLVIVAILVTFKHSIITVIFYLVILLSFKHSIITVIREKGLHQTVPVYIS